MRMIYIEIFCLFILLHLYFCRNKLIFPLHLNLLFHRIPEPTSSSVVKLLFLERSYTHTVTTLAPVNHVKDKTHLHVCHVTVCHVHVCHVTVM